MTDKDALKIADKPDWWMGPDGPRDAMRTLRAAVEAVAGCPGRAFLFRPGGFGASAIWLSAEDIARLQRAFAERSPRAA